MLSKLKQNIFNSPEFKIINAQSGTDLFFTGLRGSLPAFVISALFEQNKKIIFCSNDHNRLFKLKDDLNLLTGEDTAGLYLGEFDEEFESEVNTLSGTLKKLTGEKSFIIVTSPAALKKNVITEDSFRKNTILLSKGSDFSFEELTRKLRDFDFTKKKIVEEETDYAVRGGIIDIFPENLHQPVRIEFFGETVESIREFDPVTQRSIAQLDSIEILPSAEILQTDEASTEKLIDYIKNDTLFLLDEPDLIKEDLPEIYYKTINFKRSYFSRLPLLKNQSLRNADKTHITE